MVAKSVSSLIALVSRVVIAKAIGKADPKTTCRAKDSCSNHLPCLAYTSLTGPLPRLSGTSIVDS